MRRLLRCAYLQWVERGRACEPFPLTVRSAEHAVELLRALNGADTADLIDTIARALATESVPRLEEEAARFGAMLDGLEDPLGERAFALTVFLSAAAFARDTASGRASGRASGQTP